MSQEPEKEIEKQLREHADKRRAEAGDQLNLHAATRRLLQDEVARTYGTSPAAATTTAKTTARPWWAYWPGVLFATCCAMLLAIVFLRSGAGEEKFDYVQAERQAPAAAASFELAATSPQPYADAMPAAAPPSGEKMIASNMDRSVPMTTMQAAESQRAPQLAEPASKPVSVNAPAVQMKYKEAQADSLASRDGIPAPTAPPAPTAAPVVMPADPSAGVSLAGGARPEPAARMKVMKAAEPASPVIASPQPAVLPEVRMADGLRLAQKPATQTIRSNSLQMDTTSVSFASTATDGYRTDAGQSFVQAPGRAMLRKNYQSPPSPAVLENFQFQQNGAELKFIDSDGSVYLGNLITPEAELESTTQGLAAKDADSTRSQLDVTARSGRASGYGGAVPTNASAPRYFRAIGTNRTLNQQVVFDGTIDNIPQVVVIGGQLEAAKAEELKKKAQEMLQLQIQGRVQVGGRQELIINAVPVNR